MYPYPTDEKLIDDFRDCMRIPGIKLSLFHKLEQLKIEFKDKIEEYREIEGIIDPEKKTGEKEESVKTIRFEIRKKKADWQVSPVDIPQEIVNHIISHDLNPGVIKMEKFKLAGGKVIDLSFELQSIGFITGSISEKCSEKKTRQKIPPSKARNTDKKTDKTEDLKIFLAYLLNNENFCNWIMREFLGNWKPLIDKGCIISEH
jgi:hypothetical protein